MNLEALFEVWRTTAELHRLGPPASDAELAGAEKELGRSLPTAWRQLYRFSNGLELNNGSVRIFPLRDDEGPGALVSVSDQLRESKWRIPDEVLVFGSNGSDEIYGLWVGPHDSERFPEPIVQIGEIFEPGCMGMWAPSLRSFLIEETVIGLLFKKRQKLVAEQFGLDSDSLPDASMMDALLGVTDSTGRELVEVDRRFRRIQTWALPEINPDSRDPYAARLDVDGIAALLA